MTASRSVSPKKTRTGKGAAKPLPLLVESNCQSGCSDCAFAKGGKCGGSCADASIGSASVLPEFKVIPGISARHQHGVDYDQGDLLILTKMLGSALGPGPMCFDAHHGGAISKAVQAKHFQGAAGEHLAVEFPPEENSPSGRRRHAVVVGLGRPDEVSKRRICGFFNYALDLCAQYQAQTLVLPIFPYRLSQGSLSLTATAAILRCITAERVRRGTLSAVKEIRLLCAPQAKPHLTRGLAVQHTLCSQCHIPGFAEG